MHQLYMRHVHLIFKAQLTRVFSWARLTAVLCIFKGSSRKTLWNSCELMVAKVDFHLPGKQKCSWLENALSALHCGLQFPENHFLLNLVYNMLGYKQKVWSASISLHPYQERYLLIWKGKRDISWLFSPLSPELVAQKVGVAVTITTPQLDHLDTEQSHWPVRGAFHSGLKPHRPAEGKQNDWKERGQMGPSSQGKSLNYTLSSPCPKGSEEEAPCPGNCT